MDGNSLLAIEVGAAKTRAVFFDVIESQYRFVASGSAPTTAEAPFKDVGEGVRNAILNLQKVFGNTLLDESRGLITPSQPNGSGVDALVVTFSAGPVIKTVIVGLVKEVSLESARRLAESTYTQIVDTIGLNDLRTSDQQIDSLLHLRPDLVVITGGTDSGASRSIKKVLEPIRLACFLMPEEKRPDIICTEKNGKRSKNLVSSLQTSRILVRTRPSLETEDLDPAGRELARMFINIRKRQIKGVDTLDLWSSGHILPTGYAAGRMVRFLAKVYGGEKGILSVDIGSSAAIISAGFNRKTILSVYPQFGLGESLSRMQNYTTLEDILRWSSLDIPVGVLRNYLHQKSLYPASIPATKEDFAISQAVSRQALYLAMQSARRDFPENIATINRSHSAL